MGSQMHILTRLSRGVLAAGLAALLTLPAPSHAATRIKELVDVPGMRENMLIGYGLVVGLPGSGDSEQVLASTQALSGMLARLGVRIDPRDIRMRNVAAVMVTAKLPTFTRPGSTLDVNVSSIGNAWSLEGGTLLMTPLKGPDGKVYAVSQGAVQVGGFQAGAASAWVRRNQPTSGRVPGGAIVERAVTPKIGGETLVLSLKEPDLTTAARVAKALEATLGEGNAKALDPSAIELKVPEAFQENPVMLLAAIEQLEVVADRRAKIVINERTGTIVAGDGVRIRPVAIAHGGLQISVRSLPWASQPNPFSRGGQTVFGEYGEVSASQEQNPAIALQATTSVQELADALNAIGVTARDLIAILQAMKAAGAIDADLEVL